MNTSKVIIYGIGGLSEYIAYEIINDSPHQVVAYCIDFNIVNNHPGELKGLPIIDYNNIEKDYPPDEYKLFIALGYNWQRERIFKLSKKKGYSCISFKATNTVLQKDLVIGENTFIGEFTGFHPFVTVGDNVIVIASLVAHHCKIGNNVLLSSCTLGGGVIVGDNTFIGINSSIHQKVVIGRDSIIGMGCNITENTDDDAVYHEKPIAKRAVSSKKLRDRFLY